MKRKITARITAVLLTLTVTLFLGGTMLATETAGAQNWVSVGSAGFSSLTAKFTSLAFDNEGVPYVAYQDGAYVNKATVMKYTGSSWETVGSAGFSAGQVQYTSLAFDNEGTPYVAYQDEGISSKATVMKYNGSSWETVGTRGFSGNNASYISLVFDGGTPYVAYQDGGSSSRATVMKYNGSSWETVGSAGFSLGNAFYTSLAFDTEGTPYVAYQDYGSSSKATVMKYNGSSWVTVGSAGFSTGAAYYTSLAFDSEGTPYVAYADAAIDHYATVMKYNGSSWEGVGDAGFSACYSVYTSLTFDSEGTPYVAYGNYDNNRIANVMKYTNSSWETVGTANFSAGSANFITPVFDNEGTLYVAYQDGGNSNKATVMRLNNNAPTDLDLDNQSVSEEQAVGTVVGTLSAQDPDRYESFTYSLVSGSGDDDNGSFTINGNQLKTAAVFDYETKNIYHIRVRATDAGGLYYEDRFTVAVQNVQGDDNDNAIVVDMGPVPSGSVGSSFSFTPTVAQGTAPYTWTATGLPAGLVINSATGEISGIPAAMGTSAVSATVTDSQNAVLTIHFDITIGYADLAIDTPNLLAATLGESYSCSLTASGGDGSNAWYAGSLPAGLRMARDTGEISGTPNETGTFSVNVTVYDAEGRRATNTYSLAVSAPTATGEYEVVPDADGAYTVSTVDGFTTLTIDDGVTGFRYFNVSIQPIVSNEGEETVIFVQQREGIQVGISFVKADFDTVSSAGAGFNVRPGDTIKVYIVDSLSNSSSRNPVLLQ